MHVIAAKALAFKEALDPAFTEYQVRIVKNARTLAESLVDNGVELVSGGTDTHLMLLDLRSLDITGKLAEEVLGQAGITVNKNAIPDDPQGPAVTSGIRVGTPALTTRGMGPEQMKAIAGFIAEALKHHDDQRVIAGIRDGVAALCSEFRLYQQLPQRAALSRHAGVRVVLLRLYEPPDTRRDRSDDLRLFERTHLRFHPQARERFLQGHL